MSAASRDRSVPLLLVGLFLVTYIAPLAFRPLFLPDEYRYAEIPREMLASGDWTVPRMNGFLYFEKPVLGYWLNAASLFVFGENRFAVRLPSALATGGTAALLFALAAFATRRRQTDVPALAALIFLSGLGVAVSGNMAVFDNPLTTFLTGTLAAFFAATAARQRSRREALWLAVSGACAGLAFLTKGFLAFVVPALTAGTFLVWQRRARDLVRMAWLPLVAATIVALPWGVAIHVREPSFWHFFFWNEHVRRFLSEDAQHARPWWFFLAAAPGLLLPWTFLAPAAAAGLRDALRSEARDLIRFCLCWVAVPFVFFSASSGKLLTYVLPLLPATAILLAAGLTGVLRVRRSPALPRGLVAAAAAFALCGAGILVYGGEAAPEPRWPLVVTLALLAVSLAWAAHRGVNLRALCAIGLASGLLVSAASFTLPDRVLDSKSPGALLSAHAADLEAIPILLSDPNTARAVCWSFRRDDVILVATRGEFAFGIEQDPDSGRAVDLDGAVRLIEDNPGRVALAATSNKYERWKPLLPGPVAEDSSGPAGYVIARY